MKTGNEYTQYEYDTPEGEDTNEDMETEQSLSDKEIKGYMDIMGNVPIIVFKAKDVKGFIRKLKDVLDTYWKFAGLEEVYRSKLKAEIDTLAGDKLI